jgi:hypothetical protein
MAPHDTALAWACMGSGYSSAAEMFGSAMMSLYKVEFGKLLNELPSRVCTPSNIAVKKLPHSLLRHLHINYVMGGHYAFITELIFKEEPRF